MQPTFTQLLKKHQQTSLSSKSKTIFITTQLLLISALVFAKSMHDPHNDLHNFKSHAHYFNILSTPINGTTAFNIVAPGVKASGNASGGGITAMNIEGFNFRLTTASSATMNIEVWDGATGTGNGVAFYESSSTINPPITGIFMAANDGSRFDFKSIGINATNSVNNNASITITGLDAANNPVSGASISGTASASSITTFDVSSLTAFKGIYGVKITSGDMNYVFIDNINLANVTQSSLPVSWLNFTANQQTNAVVLNWSTAIEQGTESYKIQQNVNGKDWKTIGLKAAAGNSNTIQQYSFIHENPSAGTNYYRLLQLDVDGKEAYSKVVAVNMAADKSSFSIYPNPIVNGILNIKSESASTVLIYNSTGNLLLKKEFPGGVHQIDLSGFSKGIYSVKAGKETASFVIQ